MLCWGRVQGYRYVSRDREDVRIPILGASSFLEKSGLASMSCTVLAVAVMPTYENAILVQFNISSQAQRSKNAMSPPKLILIRVRKPRAQKGLPFGTYACFELSMSEMT